MSFLLPPFMLAFVVALAAALVSKVISLFVSKVLVDLRVYVLAALDVVAATFLVVTQDRVGWGLAYLSAFLVGALPLLVIFIVWSRRSRSY